MWPWIVAGLLVPGAGLVVLTVWVCRIVAAANAAAMSVARMSSPKPARDPSVITRPSFGRFRVVRRKVDRDPAEGAP